MDCSRYDEMLSALVDGELNEAEKEELDAHLKTCADCRNYLSLLRMMHEDLGQDLPEPPEALRRGIRYKLSLEKKKRRFGAFGVWTASAAIFCIALLGIVKLTGNDLKSTGSIMVNTAMKATESVSAAAAEGFDYIRENDSVEDNGVSNGLMTYSTKSMPNPDPFERLEIMGARQADVLPEAPEEAEPNSVPTGNNAISNDVKSIYDASTLPGYAAGMEVLNGAADYVSVGILYVLPEGLPGRNWKELPAPIGQRRWLVKRADMEALTAEEIFDELYFGDLLAESGLIIELTDEED